MVVVQVGLVVVSVERGPVVVLHRVGLRVVPKGRMWRALEKEIFNIT